MARGGRQGIIAIAPVVTPDVAPAVALVLVALRGIITPGVAPVIASAHVSAVTPAVVVVTVTSLPVVTSHPPIITSPSPPARTSLPSKS